MNGHSSSSALQLIFTSAALASTLSVSTARADDCNALIESMVVYLQSPRAPNECPGTYHVVSALVTTGRVETATSASPEQGQAPITTDQGQITASIPANPTQFLRLAFNNLSPEQIAARETPSPIVPHELISGNIDRYTSSVSSFAETGTVTLELIEGPAGGPAVVRLSSVPEVVSDSKTPKTKLSVQANPVCVGPNMSGFFDASTVFTVSLSKTRWGSC
jgi:hypothetical protein